MKKLVSKSAPFRSAKSEAVYQLVKHEDGSFAIEKVVTSLNVEVDVEASEDAHAVFTDFVKTKQQNKARNKKRVETIDAFRMHYVEGMSYRQIADHVGQKSKESISGRVNDMTRDFAYQYMRGTSIYEIADSLSISANHAAEILSNILGRIRQNSIWDYDHYGLAGQQWYSGVDLIVEITNFLNDWEHLNYQLIDPMDVSAILIAGKKPLYSTDFYDLVRESGATDRISAKALDMNLYEGFIPEQVSLLLNLPSTDRVVEVRSLLGEQCHSTLKRIQEIEDMVASSVKNI